MKTKIAIGIISLFVLTVIIAGCGSEEAGRYDEFAQCLTDKGVAMYGTSWCEFCQKQREMFGNSMRLIVDIDCDKNKAACVAAGVKSYPTWKIGDQTLTGVQQFTTLKRLTGCEIEPGEGVTIEDTVVDDTAAGNTSNQSCDLSEDGTCMFPGEI